KLADAYDARAEAQKLSEGLQTTVVQALLVGAGGLTLGTIGAVAAALIGVTFLDVTGITAGVAAIALGLFIIPARKASAKRQFNEKMQELRQRLHDLMYEQFSKE